MNNQTILTNNSEETKKFAEKLTHEITGPCVITLQGDLGAGKTTFTQGFAKGLGITQKILSPTFILLRKYDVNPKILTADHTMKEGKLKYFYHVDLYRLTSQRDIEGIGLLEAMRENNSIIVIEWPEKMGSFLPRHRVDLQFTYVDDEKRKIEIKTYAD